MNKQPKVRAIISRVCQAYFFDGESIEGLAEFIKPGVLDFSRDFSGTQSNDVVGVPDVAGDSDCHIILQKNEEMVLVRFPNGRIASYFPESFNKNFQKLN